GESGAAQPSAGERAGRGGAKVSRTYGSRSGTVSPGQVAVPWYVTPSSARSTAYVNGGSPSSAACRASVSGRCHVSEPSIGAHPSGARSTGAGVKVSDRPPAAVTVTRAV